MEIYITIINERRKLKQEKKGREFILLKKKKENCVIRNKKQGRM